MAGLVSSVAGSLGGGGASRDIQSAFATAFANLPKEEGGYGGSSGGKPMASKSDGGADLNLKSLFGAEEKEETSPGREDIAFRNIASEDDIWHSQNPKGNNLFQIVSDKYDSVQRKTQIGF